MFGEHFCEKRMRSRCSSSSAMFIHSQLMSYQKPGYVIFYSSRKNIDFVISNQHPQSRRELPLNAYYIGFPRSSQATLGTMFASAS